jgi:hypothetical protein
MLRFCPYCRRAIAAAGLCTMTKVETREEVGDRAAAPASTHALAVLYSDLAREYAE